MNGVILLVAGALFCCEVLRPLRARRREPRSRHTARNLVVAGAAATTVQLLEQPIVRPLAELAEQRRWGLLGVRGLPRWARTFLTLAALDYTLYVWHVLVHRVPFLWRFHRVHHVDIDLDASTAVRFHFGELAASVPWRILQIRLIGVDVRTLTLWQKLTLISVLFHHSDVRLPYRVERLLTAFIVTPRMHSIHHATVPAIGESNWSSGLTLWDRLHGTLRLDVPQAQIDIGVEGYEAPDDIQLPDILIQPFQPDHVEDSRLMRRLPAQ